MSESVWQTRGSPQATRDRFTAPGSQTDGFTRLALCQAGLDPATDVKSVPLQANDIADRPWTATLSVAVGAKSAVIERIWTPQTPLDLVLAVGDTFPLHTTAVVVCRV